MIFFSDLDKKAKVMRVAIGLLKIGALLILLFFFVCSLDLLSSAFRLVGGRTTGTTFLNGL
jgi:sodium-dependent phosphate cotransporter